MSPRKQALSRRELLKGMTALGGAVAASSLLPEEWAKPEVGAGVLPAHAQSTLLCIPPYAIDRCEIDALLVNQTLRITTSAWITPPCPGIELLPLINQRSPLPAEPVGPAPVVITNSEGKATYSINLSVVSLPSAPTLDVYSQAIWSFSNPGDGSGFCKTVEIHSVIDINVNP